MQTFIINNYQTLSQHKIASELGIQQDSVFVFMKNRGLCSPFNTRDKQLSSTQRQYIRDEYQYKSQSELANDTGSSMGTVNRFMKSEGLKRTQQLAPRNLHKGLDHDAIKLEYSKGMRQVDIAKKYKCTQSTVKYIIRDLK
jgi:transposase